MSSTMLMHNVTTAGGCRFLSLQLVGTLPWAGVNSHGITVTANTLPANDIAPGVANTFLSRWVLESQSLEEVWERMRTPLKGPWDVRHGWRCGRTTMGHRDLR